MTCDGHVCAGKNDDLGGAAVKNTKKRVKSIIKELKFKCDCSLLGVPRFCQNLDETRGAKVLVGNHFTVH